jgi:hypothetical protein
MAEEISVLVNDTQETVSANIAAPTAVGDVSKSGTPLVNQVTHWVDSTTIKGNPLLTYDGTTLYIGDPAFGETKIEITEDKLKVYKDAFSGFTELLYDCFKLTNQDAGVYHLKTGSDAGNTHNVKFPDSGVDVKTLAVSVNGEFADDTGDITLVVSGGIPTEQLAYTAVIKADKKYFSTGTNRHTQTADINFTVDSTGAVIDGGHIIEVVGNGSDATFTLDFGSYNGSVVKSGNKVTLLNTIIYRFVFFWTGLDMDISLGVIEDIPAPQLNAPTLSATVWDSTTQASMTVTDNNTSPNEVNTQVEWSIKDANSWTLGDTVAQDGTSATITGLSDANAYDFRAKAIGDGSTSLDSDYSSIVSLLGVTIILMQDNFDDNSIDTGLWVEVTSTNATTTESGGVLNFAGTGIGANKFGLKSLSGYSSANDLIIFQAKITLPNDTDMGCIMGLSTFPLDDNEVAAIQRNSGSPYSDYRIQVKDGGVNEVLTDTGITSGKDVRIKYVPSTGAVTFEYWNGSAWTSLGTGGNVDLGTTVSAMLYSNAGGIFTGEQADDFFLSENNYSTQYPT